MHNNFELIIKLGFRVLITFDYDQSALVDYEPFSQFSRNNNRLAILRTTEPVVVKSMISCTQRNPTIPCLHCTWAIYFQNVYTKLGLFSYGTHNLLLNKHGEGRTVDSDASEEGTCRRNDIFPPSVYR